MARPSASAEPAGSAPASVRRGRLGLFLPYIALAVLALAWTGGWFFIRARAASEMDAWLAREAAAGRAWTCADRSITGFPFRLELRCAALGLVRSDGRFTLGPVTALVQVYQPRHVLLQAAGPFHTEQGDLVGDVSWARLEGSFHGAADGFVRASLVIDEPKGRVQGAGGTGDGVPRTNDAANAAASGAADPMNFAARHIELHARPTPGRFETEGAVDVSLRLLQGAFPQLDRLLGGAEPLDAAIDATVERASVLRTRALERELETWRQADGRLDVALVSLIKGGRRLQAKGGVGLDEAHRPAGQFDLRVAGLADLVGQIMGQRFGAQGGLLGNLVGQFLGGRPRGGDAPAPGAPGTGEAPLTALPPLRLAGGRLMMGPFPIPNVSLPPLY